MEREKAIAIRAGIFLLVALAALGVSIFVLGTKRGYFKDRVILKTAFLNVRGLTDGAPIRLAGVSVGRVKRVIFPEDPASKRIDVEMEVNKRFHKRIRSDSVCAIKWLSYVTGDTYIEITVGSVDKPIVERGGYVNSREPVDYFAAFEGSLDAFSSLTRSLVKLEETRLVELFAGATAGLKENMEAVQKGEGVLHSLIFDPKGKQMFDNLFATAESLKDVTRQMREGENVFNTLLYDKEFKEGIKGLALISRKINQSLEAEHGLLHSLLFDPEKEALLDNLTHVSANLKVVTEKTARGEGTLGALVHDPALYEDLKSLMGGVQRSFLLRRMIQKSIIRGREAETRDEGSK